MSMSRSTLIIAAAFFVMISPFLGFPRSWEPTVFVILGGVILLVELSAVLARAQEAFFRDHEVNTEVYAERVKRKTPSERDEKEKETETDLNKGSSSNFEEKENE